MRDNRAKMKHKHEGRSSLQARPGSTRRLSILCKWKWRNRVNTGVEYRVDKCVVWAAQWAAQWVQVQVLAMTCRRLIERFSVSLIVLHHLPKFLKLPGMWQFPTGSLTSRCVQMSVCIYALYSTCECVRVCLNMSVSVLFDHIVFFLRKLRHES